MDASTMTRVVIKHKRKPQFLYSDRLYRLYEKDYACLSMSGKVDPRLTCEKCQCFGGYTDDGRFACTEFWDRPVAPINN